MFTYALDVNKEDNLNYEYEACCNLCPSAENPDVYNTQFLRLFRVLKQGDDGWLFRASNDLLTEFGPNDESLKKLKGFVDALKARGTTLVMVYQPPRGVVHANKLGEIAESFNPEAAKESYLQALEKFRSIGMIVPDMTPILNGTTGMGDYFFWRDNHWTPDGAKATAQQVAKAIKELPLYESLPKTSYSNIYTGLMKKTGSYQIAAELICPNHGGYADQYAKEYMFERQEVEQDENDLDLFGDDNLPEVVLIGTSNTQSATIYNFDGFLMEFLNTEVINEALAGGSFNGSMTRYLLSDEYKDAPPKVIVWEVPSYHSMNSEMFYRQLEPMANMGCQNKEAVYEQTVSLKTGINEIVFNGGPNYTDLKGGDLVFDLEFNNPYFKNLEATAWYLNRRKDTIRLDLPSRVDVNGKMVFGLNDTKQWRDFLFLSLDVVLPESLDGAVKPTEVKAKVCFRN